MGGPTNNTQPTETSQNGIDLIKAFEGLRLRAYKCSAGVWTIGYGHTGDVEPDDAITREEAEELLGGDLRRFEYSVQLNVTVPISQNQFDALVSFSYNVGVGAFRKSTLLRKLNDLDVSGAADEFLRWNKAGGQILSGLIKRRKAERQLFLGK